MASTKHEPPKVEEPEAKRAKIADADSYKAEPEQHVKLNPADCDLDFDIEANGFQGQALHKQGFAYCWSGARANVGIRGGKYCFGCKIISAQPVDMEDTHSEQQHLCRVGISRGDNNVGNLGETQHSFGFGGTGKFSNAGRFSDYGVKFGVGDTIICAVNLENKASASVGFSKNGKWLGIAKEFDAGPSGIGVVSSPVKKLPWESALFPHVLLKNVVVQVLFSVEDGLIPEEGYKAWDCAFEDGNATVGPIFSSPKECEVMMMVGLPASGKTTWAEKWIKEHPEKRYVLLGTNLALDQMKVPGLMRKQNYGERFDRLMDRATGIFNTLLDRASKTPRNYIIDQTNVYKSARKRKLKPFQNYQKIAVVIFTTPNELKSRAEKRFREMGKEVPAEAVNEMLANFVLPISKDMHSTDEFFDQVLFPELNREESQRYLEEMKLALGLVSNSKSKSNLSPYSRETSMQSFANPIPPNQATAPATSEHWQNSCSLLPPSYDYPRPQEVSSTYSGRLRGQSEFISGGYRSKAGDPNPSLARDSHYGNYDPYQNYGGVSSYSRYNYESNSPRGDLGPYQSYMGVDTSVKPYFENSTSILRSDTTPHRSYGVFDPYSRANFERENSFGSNFGSLGAPISYRSPGGHLRDPQHPYSALPQTRELAFGPHHPSPTSYGSPYGTPPLRPTYGNIPATEWQQSGGYPSPRPRYY